MKAYVDITNLSQFQLNMLLEIEMIQKEHDDVYYIMNPNIAQLGVLVDKNVSLNYLCNTDVYRITFW